MTTYRFSVLLHLALLAHAWTATAIFAGEPDSSDPARLAPAPAGAIGWPSREAKLDALPGFKKPPRGYGEVGFYWWLGDPLTQERLAWQLDELAKVQGVMGLQVNYAHSDRGGRSYGLTYPSEPPLFSEPWWKLFGWFLQEAKRRGMAASLSDYTLGLAGQGFWVDEILRETPSIHGATLGSASRDAAGESRVDWELPEHLLAIVAYRMKDGAIQPGSGVDLRRHLSGRTLRWKAPAGTWKLVAVFSRPEPVSLDPMHPLAGKKVIEKVFDRFESRCPGESGTGLNFFFSDELQFGVSGNLWNERFAEEFRKRKGYDLPPELPALFFDIGPRTPKVRLDYSDVLVSLSEENFFRPLFQWHYDRGMVYGCDHGGRGTNVVEFGDYFRTQRWMTGPGNDSPGLSSDVIKNKVASSIAHLYDRPRVWLEGYYGSGWGTSTAQLTDATFRNYAHGHNLLTLHGLYYSTHGGWWEWAPPCNHFRMPYWPHMREFLACVQRLSYLMSQGRHRCDVAILYPVAAMEAGTGGEEAVAAAFNLARHLAGRAIDFDFIDFESLARAKVAARELRVSGEEYRVLVLPAMRSVRFSTLQKAQEFYRSGGIVINLGALPEASDRAGRDDPQLDSIVEEVFGVSSGQARAVKDPTLRQNDVRGMAMVVQKAEQVEEAIDQAFPRDFRVITSSSAASPARPQVLHRKIGPRDVYLVHGVPKHSTCFFRARGKVECWDPWTGGSEPLHVVRRTADGTEIRMPREATEAQLIVFSPGEPGVTVEKTDLDEVVEAKQENGEIVVRGFAATGGQKTAFVRIGDQVAPVTGDAPAPQPAVALEGDWEFTLQPTMDNRFGDFHWPPANKLVGPEARQFRYADEVSPNPGWQAPDLDDSHWARTTYSYGPRFWKLGPLPDNADAAALERKLASQTRVDPSVPIEVAGKKYSWQPYDFSMRFGVEGDPGHQGYHGLKEQVADEFIALGKLKETWTSTSREKEEGGSRYYLWSSVAADRGGNAWAIAGGLRPAVAWLNSSRLDKVPSAVALHAGSNPLLLRYDAPGRGFFVVSTRREATTDDPTIPFSPAAFWIWYPNDRATADRFFRKTFPIESIPAKARLRITCDNAYAVSVNGQEVGRGNRWETVQEFDVRDKLRPGTNVLTVSAHNDGDSAGLIAELVQHDSKGNITRLATDATWRCSKAAEPKWREPSFVDRAWPAAERISPFDGSLWATHQNGPPKLDLPPEPIRADRPSPLAMRWHNDASLLPYDVRPTASKPAGWYRFTSPPGLQAMTIVARGTVQAAWANGKPMRIEGGTVHTDGTRSYRAVAVEPTPNPVKVAIRIEQDRGCYAGAAIPEPIELQCGTGKVALGDWSKIDGLACYSGGAWYRKHFNLFAPQASSRVILNLGNVVSSAEIRVNGKPAGTKVAPPWKLDISGLVQPGENQIEILVCNTLANHYLTIPTRYRGEPTSGLLGPVRIEFSSLVRLRGRLELH